MDDDATSGSEERPDLAKDIDNPVAKGVESDLAKDTVVPIFSRRGRDRLAQTGERIDKRDDRSGYHQSMRNFRGLIWGLLGSLVIWFALCILTYLLYRVLTRMP
jgi:hypothetical protein